MFVPIGDPRRVFAVGLWFRVVCASAFLVFIAACEAIGVRFVDADVPISYLCLLALVGLNAGYWMIGRVIGFDLRQFYFHWLVDIILISGVLKGLGPASLIAAIPAYSLIIITSATFISRFASFVVASGSSVAFVFLTVNQSEQAATASIEMAASAGPAFIVGNGIIFFYLFAFLAGTLASALSNANAQLSTQNQQLADKNEELDRLQREVEFQTRVLTHDIKGPIAAAASAVGLLRQGRSGAADMDNLVEMAVENLVRADEMIEDLREVQRSGASDISKVEVDVREICASLRLEFGPQLEARGVVVEIGRLPVVNADPRGVRIVFRNLLANAVRYVPDDGSGLITIRAEDRIGGWEIVVGDNGPGIPVEQRGEVFRSFWKSPGERQSEGLGLGLAIAKRVMEQHGGRIAVGGSESGGAEFRVFFAR